MNTKLNLRRKICLSILTCVVIIFAGTTTHTVKAQTYDPYAVQVINNLIANNGLQAIPDAPETWGFFSWWNDSTPKQLLGLGIVNKGLTGAVVLSGLRNMIGLNIFDNSVTKLDVSGCSQLQWLWCWRNNITDIDLKDCAALEDFQCSENYLEKLDVSNCVNLKLLICPSNKLTDLDLTNNTQLEGIGIENNNFTKFNAPYCIKLRALTFKNNKLTELDITRHKQLKFLTGEKNRLTELNITGLGYFNTFELYNQNVSIDIERKRNRGIYTLYTVKQPIL